MNGAKDTVGVYRHVIDDVVTRVRTQFVEEGVDEAVLDELRDLWETKLLSSGALEPPAPPAPTHTTYMGPTPQYYHPAQAGLAQPPFTGMYSSASVGYDSQLGKPEPYGGHPMGFAASVPAAAPTAHTLQQLGLPAQQLPSQPPLQYGQQLQTQPMQYQPPQQVAQQVMRPHAPAVVQSGAELPAAGQPQPQLGAPPQMQPQAQVQPGVLPPPGAVQQQPAAAVAAAADSRKRPLEGASQGPPQKQQFVLPPTNGTVPSSTVMPSIPQQDGNEDDADGIADDGAADNGGGGGGAFEADDEGDDPLAGLSSDEDEEGAEIPNVVLAQFEKVSRTKTRTGTKWKCALKNGIMHLNGRDHLFKKCNGEMEF